MAYSRYATERNDIFDMTLNEYGDIRYVFLTLFDNDLEITDDLAAGQALRFQEDSPTLLLKRNQSIEPPKPLVEKRYGKRIEDGQDIFDMTIQEYGDLRFLPAMLFDNGLEASANLLTGQALSFRDVPPESLVVDAEILDYFRRNEIRVNTHAPRISAGWWETVDGEYWETVDGEYWELQNQ